MIVIYVLLVVCYYLSTMKRAYILRMKQHSAYIQSFSDILREVEIENLLNNTHFENAKIMFYTDIRHGFEILALVG